jgi:hypothetical protein
MARYTETIYSEYRCDKTIVNAYVRASPQPLPALAPDNRPHRQKRAEREDRQHRHLDTSSNRVNPQETALGRFITATAATVDCKPAP